MGFLRVWPIVAFVQVCNRMGYFGSPEGRRNPRVVAIGVGLWLGTARALVRGMETRIHERTMVAGIEVKVRGQKALNALFKKLGGRVDNDSVSDKGLDLIFPSQAAADEFQREAKARGAIFEKEAK